VTGNHPKSELETPSLTLQENEDLVEQYCKKSKFFKYPLTTIPFAKSNLRMAADIGAVVANKQKFAIARNDILISVMGIKTEPTRTQQHNNTSNHQDNVNQQHSSTSTATQHNTINTTTQHSTKHNVN
jgi:hypothetical protein